MHPSPALHPSEETLEAYGLGKLDDAAIESIDSHLSSCDVCRDRVASVSSADSFLGRLRDPGVGLLEGRRPASGAPAPEGTAHPLGESAGPLPPELSDHSQSVVVRELGRGGMGVVYLARNTLLDRFEVLKVLKPEFLERGATMDRFLREIRAAARLDHENIVRVYSAQQVGERLVLAMEYVEGDDLAEFVRSRGPLSIVDACDAIRQVAEGLQHAHERGIVHRDIKPANLMITSSPGRPIVKILDFGLGKAVGERSEDQSTTDVGQLLGTPDYVAPEQMIDARNADIRSDIYSLGCTFYCLLTGSPPFPGPGVYDILQAHMSMNARPLHLLRSDVPIALTEVVGRMMVKDPAQRFQTPSEVAEALTPFLPHVGKASAFPGEAFLQPGGWGIGEDSIGPKPSETFPATAERTTLDTAWRRSETECSEVEVPHQGARDRAHERVREAVDSARSPRRGRRGPAIAIVVAAVGIGLAGTLAILRVQTTRGILLLEDLPTQSKVFVNGERVTLTWPGNGEPVEVSVSPGRRLVQVRKDGFLTFGSEVIVAGGARKPLKIRLVPIPDADSSVPRTLPTIGGGTWRVEGDELVQTSLDHGTLLAFGEPSWSSYDLKFRAMSTDGTHGFKILLQVEGPRTYREFALGNYYNKAHDLGFWRSGQWGRHDAMWRPGRIEPHRWYDVRVEVRGAECRGYLDGELLFADVDERFTRGRIAFSTWESAARFRDIRVTSPDGNVLWQGLPRPPAT